MVSVTVHLLQPNDVREGAFDPVFLREANRQAEWLAASCKDSIKNLACPNGHEPTGKISIAANYERGPTMRKDDFCCEELKDLVIG